MPRPTAALLVLPLTALLLTGCGGSDDTASAPTLAPEVTAAPTTATPSATPSEAPTSDAPAPPSPTVEAFDGKAITVTFAGGKITPEPGSQEVAVGTRVRLTVTSDVPEEVHVHTYDLTAQIAPGTPGVIEFVASIPGQHEVELEESREALFELVVR